jgi:predicted transcriptional regulator
MKLSDEQMNLVEEFVAAYNGIDQYLRKALRREQSVPYSVLLSEYARSHSYWKDTADYLRMIGDLRNCIIHGKTKPYDYLAIPTHMMVERLATILERLKNPERVIPKFKRKVRMVLISDSIVEVLKAIPETDFSQFPVYAGKSFEGLLTENGITRWLARHVSNGLSLVELAKITVGDTLKNEEKRKNWSFIPRNMTFDELKEAFATNSLLEATLITENGDSSETLLGIATRWDILQKTDR